MQKLKLIIEREYLSIVGRKSFIFMTILIPIAMVLCFAVPIGIAYLNDSGSDVQTVAVLDETGRYGGAIDDSDLYRFVPMTADSVGDPHEFYRQADGAIAAVVVIPADVDSSLQVTVYSDNTINAALKMHIDDCMSDTLTGTRIASYGVPGLQKMIEDSSVNVDVKGVKWSTDGSETETSTEIAMILGMVLSLITYMFVLMYGAMIMNGVIEEKTNRIVEVMASSCKPFQLMMGKVIGVGLVGLTQVAIWVVLLGILTAVGGSMLGLSSMGSAAELPTMATTPATTMPIDPDVAGVLQQVMNINFGYIIGCFVLYFIGGYLLFAALFAAFGSAVDQASDASQFTTPIMLIMVIALYAGIACAENPSGPMAVWCSMIPFTSPIVMMVRLPYEVPLWQLALSIAILFATAILTVWLAARIYRTGILRYGKKNSFKDIVKWIK
ncbi:MAG: ABC transporter permease [Muribaculaceae bacterium]|nr:ABC transporter permease [Muribaculaceae bacterium]